MINLLHGERAVMTPEGWDRASTANLMPLNSGRWRRAIFSEPALARNELAYVMALQTALQTAETERRKKTLRDAAISFAGRMTDAKTRYRRCAAGAEALGRERANLK